MADGRNAAALFFDHLNDLKLEAAPKFGRCLVMKAPSMVDYPSIEVIGDVEVLHGSLRAASWSDETTGFSQAGINGASRHEAAQFAQ